MPQERNTDDPDATAEHEPVCDDRFQGGFDPTVLPVVTERLTRISSAILRNTPEFHQAVVAGNTEWLPKEAASMAQLLQETMQLRLTDLTPPGFIDDLGQPEVEV